MSGLAGSSVGSTMSVIGPVNLRLRSNWCAATNGRDVPIGDKVRCSKERLFDQLIGG